jgi:hypothetical protein
MMKSNLKLVAIIPVLAGFVLFPRIARAQKQNEDRPPQAASRVAAGSPDTSHRDNPNRPVYHAENALLGHRLQPVDGPPYHWLDTMRGLTPRERESVFQNSQLFRRLPFSEQQQIRRQLIEWDSKTPQQQADQRVKEEIWCRLTPEQRSYIRNYANPWFQQLRWERQLTLIQKLGILQNMPESARNQRLNDPNFTKGMSDDEKSMLQRLSHTHVGAPPDSPNE